MKQLDRVLSRLKQAQHDFDFMAHSAIARKKVSSEIKFLEWFSTQISEVCILLNFQGRAGEEVELDEDWYREKYNLSIS